MSAAGQSPAARAAALRARARKGVWRRLLAFLGFPVIDARTEGLARRAEIGAEAEKATGAQLRVLESRGWYVLHGRQVPGYPSDLDHVLVPPTGTAVVVLDTKRWHAQRDTHLKGGAGAGRPGDRSPSAASGVRRTVGGRLGGDQGSGLQFRHGAAGRFSCS